MSITSRLVVVGTLVLAVGATLALKRDRAPAVTAVSPSPAAALPRLVEVGSDTCVPCRAMMPVLEELRHDYSGRLRVDVIDLVRSPAEADPFHVVAMPTQIFIDPSGRELHRHLGFISKAEIVDTWRRLGVDLRTAGKGRP
jgi:thioredoxin 1